MCFKMPKVEMPKVETSAREILPSTESQTPDSPAFGGKDDPLLNKGKESLKINLNPPVTNATLTKSRGVTGFNVK